MRGSQFGSRAIGLFKFRARPPTPYSTARQQFLSSKSSSMPVRPLGSDRSVGDFLTLFLPGANVPPEAGPASNKALGILLLCTFTTTYTEPQYRNMFALLRMGLSIPAIYYFMDYAWFNDYPNVHNRAAYMGMSTVASVGIMRVLEICWIRELDDDRPKWIKTKPAKAAEGADEILPMPTTLKERLAYAFDLFTTFRGVSWFRGTAWDFAHSSVKSFKAPSRFQFFRGALTTIALQYVICDVCDTFIREGMTWSKVSPYPLTQTGLPLYIQFCAAVAVLCLTIVCLFIPYYVNAIICVALGASPSAWQPPLNQPFLSTSLEDFWSRRWHSFFRRVFGRISTAVFWPFSIQNPALRKTLKHLVFFIASLLLHVAILKGLPSRAQPYSGPDSVIADASQMGTVKFFISQPLGLLIESAVIFPITEDLSPRSRQLIRRLYAWGWLLWTGRWWADDWIGNGMYDDSERPLAWSPIRGILYGRWIV